MELYLSRFLCTAICKQSMIALKNIFFLFLGLFIVQEVREKKEREEKKFGIIR